MVDEPKHSKPCRHRVNQCVVWWAYTWTESVTWGRHCVRQRMGPSLCAPTRVAAPWADQLLPNPGLLLPGYVQAKVGSNKRNPCICVPRRQSQLLCCVCRPSKFVFQRQSLNFQHRPSSQQALLDTVLRWVQGSPMQGSLLSRPFLYKKKWGELPGPKTPLEVLYLKWRFLLWSLVATGTGAGVTGHGPARCLHCLPSHRIPAFPTSTTPSTLQRHDVTRICIFNAFAILCSVHHKHL